ncbi:hypothetical protein A6R75_07545 [Pseudomonas aeruginosa]|nr:hypothetical protein A6R75_07545 [Pseudomonas aeruginosa]
MNYRINIIDGNSFYVVIAEQIHSCSSAAGIRLYVKSTLQTIMLKELSQPGSQPSFAARIP